MLEQTAATGGDRLVVAGGETAEVAKLVVASTEPCGRIEALEAAHTSDATFDAAVILLKAIVQVGAGPVLHAPAERRTNGSRVGPMSIRGHAVRDRAGSGLCGPEECPGRSHVAVLAEHGVDESPMPVDRP